MTANSCMFNAYKKNGRCPYEKGQKKKPARKLASESGGYLFVLCSARSPRCGNTSGAKLGVPSGALLHRHNACSTHRYPRYCTASTREVLSYYIQRTPHLADEGFRKWRLPTLPQRSAVPSAMLSLTTLFGMGRGGTSAL